MRDGVYDAPTERMADLCDRTEAALRTLHRSLDALAARRADSLVPPVPLRLAKTLLADARRVLSREPRCAVLLRAPPDLSYAELLPLLALATAALVDFRQRHSAGGEWDARPAVN